MQSNWIVYLLNPLLALLMAIEMVLFVSENTRNSSLGYTVHPVMERLVLSTFTKEEKVKQIIFTAPLVEYSSEEIDAVCSSS